MKTLMEDMQYDGDDLKANRAGHMTARQADAVRRYFDTYARRFSTLRTMALVGAIAALLILCFVLFAQDLLDRIPENRRFLILVLGIAVAVVPIAIVILHRSRVRSRIGKFKHGDTQVQFCSGRTKVGWFGAGAGKSVFQFRVGKQNFGLLIAPPQDIASHFNSEAMYRAYYVDAPHLPLLLSIEKIE